MLEKFGADFAVILAYFCVILGVGLWCSRGSKSVDGFTLGDRNIAWWAVLASILASEISAATFLGAPGEGFSKRNWGYLQLAIGTVLARIFVSFVFIPAYYRHNVTSIYEFLQHRFGVASRQFGSATFMLTRVLAMGTRLFVSAIILVLACEMIWDRSLTPQEKFWLYAGAVVLVTLLTALYTAIGGIKAVIWTDFIQIGVLFASIGFTVWFLLGELPQGWTTVANQIKEPVFFNTLPGLEGESVGAWLLRLFSEEYTIYTAFIASTVVTMATHGIDQDAVQRMLTAKNKRQSALATIMSGLVDIPVVGAFILVGVMLSAFYATNAPADLPTVGREVFPYFILHQMPPGLRGLVAAGLLATAMGSLSTALNALGTSFAKDFIFPPIARREGVKLEDIDQSRQVRILRFSTALFAVLIIIVGVYTAYYSSVHQDVRIIPLVLGILGFTFGSLLGVFLIAIFTKYRGNDKGNIIGMCCGFAVVFLLSSKDLQYTVHMTRKLEDGTVVPFLVLAFPWRVTLGALVTVLISLCFRTPVQKVAELEQLEKNIKDAETAAG